MPLHGSAFIPKLPVELPPTADGSSFAIYKAAGVSHSAIELPAGTTPQDFFIDAANYQLPHAVLTSVRSCAQMITRGASEIALDVGPTIQLFLYISGTSVLGVGDEPVHLQAGDVVILDSLRGFRSDTSAFDVRIVQMARDRAPLGLLAPGVHGMRLAGAEPGTRVLATLIESLLREADGLGIVEADYAVTSIGQLAAGLAATQLARGDRGRARFTDPSLDDAMAYIDREFRRTDLTPEQVRKHVGISRSGLYRLFAPFNGIDHVIRQRRLDDAMRWLLTDVGTELEVPELATRHGFRNETHFVRAFVARYGVTPLRFRNKLATGDRKWLMDQAQRAGFASLEAWIAKLRPGPVPKLADADAAPPETFAPTTFATILYPKRKKPGRPRAERIAIAS